MTTFNLEGAENVTRGATDDGWNIGDAGRRRFASVRASDTLGDHGDASRRRFESVRGSTTFLDTVRLPDLPVLPPAESTFLSSVVMQEQVQTVLVFEARAAPPGIFTERTLTRHQLYEELYSLTTRGDEPCSQATLTPRDIRALDPRFGAQRCAQLSVRRGAILASFLGVGAFIFPDRFYVLPVAGDDLLLDACRDSFARLTKSNDSRSGKLVPGREASGSPYELYVGGKGQGSVAADGKHGMPFELVALEAVLMGVCSELHSETSRLTTLVSEEFSHLTDEVDASPAALKLGARSCAPFAPLRPISPYERTMLRRPAGGDPAAGGRTLASRAQAAARTARRARRAGRRRIERSRQRRRRRWR
jgi:hypothetical protein